MLRGWRSRISAPRTSVSAVEIISADDQNKPDIGSNITRQWYDEQGENAILDVPTSSVALAVAEITAEKNGVLIDSGAGSTEFTQAQCQPTTIHWTYDTAALANGTGKAMTEAGGKKWFFLTADYTFGHSLEENAAKVVTANGGEVAGDVDVPFPATDFSSFLLQVEASGTDVIGQANAGGDTVNAIKQASEFGITQAGQKLAAPLISVTDVHALGAETAHGLSLMAYRHRSLWGSFCLASSTDPSTRFLSLGLAVIFGLLNIINFAHGAQS